MPETKWPENRRVIGTRVPRLDGPAKALGTARYGYDINRKGMLHAMILRCPHPHARIKSLDTSAAEKTPGFKGLYLIKKAGAELFYAGDEILAIAADTEEHAADAIRAVKVEYELLDFYVKEEDALKNQDKPATIPGFNPKLDKGNIRPRGQRTVGDVEDAFRKADAVVEGTYGVPVQTHVCLETHGLVAEWDGPNLTVWCSTQAVPGIADNLRGYFATRVKGVTVKCITHYMGGGYGSKFIPGVEGIAACELALQTKQPVKLFLDREAEHLAGGNRPSATAKVRIAGTKDGKITAFAMEAHGTPGGGSGANAVDAYQDLCPYVYTVPNIRTNNLTVRLNTGDRRAMRAPGHPQACFITESAVDDLCNALIAKGVKIDPMQLRLQNLPDDFRRPIYEREIKLAAERSEWAKKWHPAGADKGVIKHGIGMALHTWGGAGRGPNDVYVTIHGNGSVVVQCSTQDLGTGERTVLAIVVAEVLGLNPQDIKSEIGESPIGRSTASGGSTTCPGTSPAALNAAAAARDQLFAKIAPKLGAKAEDLAIDPAKPGMVIDKASGKAWAWKEACARLGMDTVRGQGDWTKGLSSQGVGGVQVAEVTVDTETGVVRCRRIVAVQDCGLIINKLGCESQTAGGVIMGVHYAMFEDRLMDRHTGRQVNPDMEFYKLAGMEDIPEIIVEMVDMPERGVIGIGEPPTIGTAAAIGNAICNAIGVRVPFTPFSPDKVLAALAKKGGAQ
jgi:xanthine dehydrogenase YagR molybdenum-binding subunit